MGFPQSLLRKSHFILEKKWHTRYNMTRQKVGIICCRKVAI